MTVIEAKKRITIAKSYFEKVDAGDPSFLELVTDDIQFFFPKWGVSKGKDALQKCGEHFRDHLKSISHNIDSFNYVVQGDFVVVEGSEQGELANGKHWPDKIISQGLFCNVFQFEGDQISRLHIYVDPDFASEDTARIKAFRGE
jgi:hypothetical protein